MNIKEKELWKYLKNSSKPIVLYGMGNGADKIINVLNSYDISFSGVFASDGFVRNKEFHGHKISSYDLLKQKFGDMIVLLCFGSSRDEVIENIKRISQEQELYAPEVPVIGGGLFTEEYLNSNLDALNEVYNSLADEKSRETFEDIINFKLSGKIDYLFHCEVSEAEPYESFLKLNKKEDFLDLGAYNGDTVKDFLSRVKEYNSIIAVEPDEKSYRKLSLNMKDTKNVVCVNKCISSFSGKGNFGMYGGRNSTVASNGRETEFITVDSLLKGKPVSYIKMDVEGQEAEAIKGARETILKCKPKMLISCYHKTDDFLKLPKAVNEIRGDYKIYLRHFSSVPAWDTNFYFI